MTYISIQPGHRTRTLGSDPMAEIYAGAQQVFHQDAQAQLNHAISQVMSRMEKEMKERIIRSTATQLGIVASIQAIPVVGQALAVASGLAMQIGGAKYQAESEQIIKEAISQLEVDQANSMKKISGWLDAAFNAEKQAALDMAVSGEPLQGLSGLGFFKKIVKEIERGIDRVGKQVDRSLDDVSKFMQEEVYDPITGRVFVVEARRARDKMLKEGREKLAEHERKARADIDSPAFRHTLRISMAQAIRQAIPSNLVGAGLKAPGGNLVAPAIAAGAVVLASLLGIK